VPAQRTILLLSGSVRAGSTNETMLRTAADLAPAAGARAVAYAGLGSGGSPS